MADELFSGSQVVLYAAREGTYGSARKINGADAFFTVSESLTPAEERNERTDRSGHADFLEDVVGRKSADFEVQRLLLPSGSVTTPPDDDILWQNAFGRVSINSTGVEYILATAHDWALTLRRGVRTGGGQGVADLQDHVRGAIVNRTEMAWGNQGDNGQATVSFAGMAKEWGWTGNTTIGSGYVSIGTGAASFRVSSPKQLAVGGLFKINADSGGGSGIVVDAINYTNGVVSFSETLDATHSSGAVIAPYNPTGTTAGSPITGRVGFLSLDGSATKIDHLGGRITFEDNRTLLNEEVGYDSPSRAYRDDRRRVTFSFDFIVKKDQVGTLLGDMSRNTAQNVQVNIGDAANKTVKCIMRNAKWRMSSLDIPAQSATRITMQGMAFGTNGNDSLKVRFM